MDDKLKGGLEEARGKAKEEVGDATDDPQMEVEGKWDQAKGDMRQAVGDAKQEVGREMDESRR